MPKRSAEWSVWWATPVRARLYVTAIVGLALLICLTSLAEVKASELVSLAGLLVVGVANVELGRLAEGGRVDQQRLHKGLSAWPFAAALLLPVGLAGWTAGAVYTHAWFRGIRITRWKWIGSWAVVVLSAAGASALFHTANTGPLPAPGSLRVLGAVGLALVVFLGIETALLAAISRLNSPDDEAYLRAQLATRAFYFVEACVLATGAVAAVLFRYWPGFLLLALPAFGLIQRGLLHQPLKEEARCDAKTGLLNYEAWRSAATAVLPSLRRAHPHVAALLIDVDHFKSVNDVHGHLIGNDVLTGIASAVIACTHKTDVVGRFGGDEFCALLSAATPAEAETVAERIRAEISAMTFSDPDLRITISIGLAVTGAEAPWIDLLDLVATADRALYEAKREGRDRVHVRSAA